MVTIVILRSLRQRIVTFFTHDLQHSDPSSIHPYLIAVPLLRRPELRDAYSESARRLAGPVIYVSKQKGHHVSSAAILQSDQHSSTHRYTL